MSPNPQRNRLLSWYIGIVVVLGAVAFVAYRAIVTDCPAPLAIIGVLLVIPIVYLTLMYLTFVSQD
jgi:hypothetical protein